AVLLEAGRGTVPPVLVDECGEGTEGGGGRCPAGGQRVVDLRGAPDQEQRPRTVGDDVVQLPEPEVPFRGEAQHRRAGDLARGRVEGGVDACPHPLLRRPPRVRLAGEVDERHGVLPSGPDPLPGAVRVLAEDGGQRLRLGEGRADGLPEEPGPERSGDVQVLGVGVREPGGVQPQAVPDPGLALGERKPGREAGGGTWHVGALSWEEGRTPRPSRWVVRSMWGEAGYRAAAPVPRQISSSAIAMAVPCRP